MARSDSRSGCIHVRSGNGGFRMKQLAPFLVALASAAGLQAESLQPAPPAGTEGNFQSSATLGLNQALSRLAVNPRDGRALIDAGKAALEMGDVDAAIGFFNRADSVMPDSAEVRTGLARGLVRNENPYDAIPMFDAAEAVGAAGSEFSADRGLAYDLVSDNLTAQKFYRQALAIGPSDEVSRRLALSLAIAGDKNGSEATLAPLLQKQDKAAWRTRAFSLAILGQVDQAIAIASQTLSPELAGAISPYFRFMPRLTPAQQAAAANFGHFPRASEIGLDDPRVAGYAPRTRPKLASADAALTPRGEPLGRNSRRNRGGQSSRSGAAVQKSPATPVATSAVTPAQVAVAPSSALASAPARPQVPQATSRPETKPTVALVVPQTVPTLPPASVARPEPVISGGSAAMEAPDRTQILLSAGTAPVTLETHPVAASAAPAIAPPSSTPQPSAPVVQKLPEPRRSIADAFADFDRPSISVTPAAGAVDVRRIAPARPKTVEAARSLPPSHPSRIWVQVATGRDKTALGHDWRRLAKQAEAVFRGKSPMVSAWGQTNRLLAGPFPSESAADAFLGQLRRADIDGPFRWTSPAGQVVDALRLK